MLLISLSFSQPVEISAINYPDDAYPDLYFPVNVVVNLTSDAPAEIMISVIQDSNVSNNGTGTAVLDPSESSYWVTFHPNTSGEGGNYTYTVKVYYKDDGWKLLEQRSFDISVMWSPEPVQMKRTTPSAPP